VHQSYPVTDRRRELAWPLGGLGYAEKPSAKETLGSWIFHPAHLPGFAIQEPLIVEDDEGQRQSIVELIGNGALYCLRRGSGSCGGRRLKALNERAFRLLVLDLGSARPSCFQLLETNPNPRIAAQTYRVIVYNRARFVSED